MTTNAAELPELRSSVATTVNDLVAAARNLPVERQQLLDEAAQFVAGKLAAGDEARLTFICTHNSRRSHLAQVWAQIAADYYGLEPVGTYSGGTEATACNIRTVAALRRAGLEVIASTSDENPKYLVRYAENREPFTVFSKIYNEAPNPASEYAAMMCCADVDERCPVATGAEARVGLHYVDPKAADDTPEEATTYDERCRQIGAEMFYVFARTANLLGAK